MQSSGTDKQAASAAGPRQYAHAMQKDVGQSGGKSAHDGAAGGDGSSEDAAGGGAGAGGDGAWSGGDAAACGGLTAGSSPDSISGDSALPTFAFTTNVSVSASSASPPPTTN